MRRMFGEGGVRLLFGGRPLRSHCTGRGRARPVQVLQPFRCPRHKQIAPNCPEGELCWQWGAVGSGTGNLGLKGRD